MPSPKARHDGEGDDIFDSYLNTALPCIHTTASHPAANSGQFNISSLIHHKTTQFNPSILHSRHRALSSPYTHDGAASLGSHSWPTSIFP